MQTNRFATGWTPGEYGRVVLVGDEHYGTVDGDGASTEPTDLPFLAGRVYDTEDRLMQRAYTFACPVPGCPHLHEDRTDSPPEVWQARVKSALARHLAAAHPDWRPNADD